MITDPVKYPTGISIFSRLNKRGSYLVNTNHANRQNYGNKAFIERAAGRSSPTGLTVRVQTIDSYERKRKLSET